VEFLPLDLSDFASVRRSAEEFLSRDLPLAPARQQRGPGREGAASRSPVSSCISASNHMGHFLFTKLLLPRIEDSPPARTSRWRAGRISVPSRSTGGRAAPDRVAPFGLPSTPRRSWPNVLFSPSWRGG